MTDPLPVPILRLPRGPDSSGSRGFSWDHPLGNSPRDPLGNSQPFPGASPELQRARAALRERFLRLLGRARGRPARFWLRGGAALDAEFGAADAEPERFQVDSLRTPLGVQGSALLRCGDVLAFSCPLAP